MLDGGLQSAVFPFERVLPDLSELPIAARRALDHAGLRLSIEGWRSLPLDERRRLALCGSVEVVDVGTVVVAIRRANPTAQSIDRAHDPDPVTPPIGITRSLAPSRSVDGRTWARLRPLDRYALAHAHRRSVARNDPTLLSEAFDAIVLPSRSIAPPRNHASVAPEDDVRPVNPAWTVGTHPRGSNEPRPSRPASGAPPGEYFHSVRESAPPRPPSGSPERASGDSERAAPISPSEPGPGTISTHLTAAGEVRMVDVGGKETTHRRAVASGSVRMARDTISRLSRNETPKGEVLATARLAGIMAAKRTPELIPLCHSISLTNVVVHLDLDTAALRVNVTAIAEADGKTGVEMEALTAVSVACLTIYDMLKGIDRSMVIADVTLLEKSGGKTGHYRREGAP